MNLRLLLSVGIASCVLSGCGPADEKPATTIAPTEVAAIKTPPPDYPIEPACTSVGGKSVLKVVIGPQGAPTEVTLLRSSGSPQLDESAGRRVREWQFKPATRNGQAVAATIQVPVSFNPPQPKPDACFAIEERLRRGG